MKKCFKILLILLCFSLLVGCKNKENKNLDAIKFKEEYENLNDSENYIKLNISKDNPFIYANYEDIMEIIDTTGIIYFGFPECPWCRNAVEPLIKAANKTGIKEIYYYNIKDIRNTLILDENGNIITKKEGTDEYNSIVKALYDDLDVYEGLNDDRVKRIYAPTVVFIKDGEVVGLHTSTVSTHKNPSIKMTNEQEGELINIYEGYIHKVLDDLCTDAC